MRDVWILADPHTGARAGDHEALLDLLNAFEATEADLLILGDLFAAWLGRPKFWTAPQREVLARLTALRQSGRRITFINGNRDYLVEPLAGSVFDAVIADEALLDLAGVPTLVLHGDRLNPDDWPYLAWRALSRSAPATFLLRRLPGFIGRVLASRVEHSLAGVNTEYKSQPLPAEALARLARRAVGLGARRVLLGHFHDPRQITEVGGVEIVIAPGWVDHGTILVADAQGHLRTRGEEEK